MDSKETLLNVLKSCGIKVENKPGGAFITKNGVRTKIGITQLMPDIIKDPDGVREEFQILIDIADICEKGNESYTNEISCMVS